MKSSASVAGEEEEELVAFIPTIATSVMMNRLFRNVRENENLDLIEESEDDEDDEEEVDEEENSNLNNNNKYVDLAKTLDMECEYNARFQKWTPIRVLAPQDRL